jgi:hypothetical protein
MDIHDRWNVLYDLLDPSANTSCAYWNRNACKRLRQFYTGTAHQRRRNLAYSFCRVSYVLFAHRKALHESEVASPAWELDCGLGCSNEVGRSSIKGRIAIVRKLGVVLTYEC